MRNAVQPGLVSPDDLVSQRAQDPCNALFADSFESGDTKAWTSPSP
ncbi:MAG: hypothetical protein ABIV06_09890 [Thermoanaerobaculia bacterium]